MIKFLVRGFNAAHTKWRLVDLADFRRRMILKLELQAVVAAFGEEATWLHLMGLGKTDADRGVQVWRRPAVF